VTAGHPDVRCYLINSGNLGDDFAGVQVVDHHDRADIVALGDAGEELSYTQMNHALGLLLDGAALVGMQRNAERTVLRARILRGRRHGDRLVWGSSSGRVGRRVLKMIIGTVVASRRREWHMP
jgi:hypothetical protein